ncbi:MAG: ORF6N domain-containing protein, partial [Bacteroidales bacterium]|nr:ORF6N domain-containing protein [Bacteroidales bacterium]
NRNSARFPHNFRFVLTKAECDEVVAKCDHLQSLKYRPTLPYAFTEQDIGQLSSVLHSKKAYLLGASLKDMVVGLCAITEMNATPESILGLVTSQ